MTKFIIRSYAITIFSFLMCVANIALAYDKVVVIPLNSSKPQALAQINLEAGGAQSLETSEITLQFIVGANYPNGATLFDLLVTAQDQGITVPINSSNNTDFELAMVILTNGIDDICENISITNVGIGTLPQPESKFLQGAVTGESYPDLIGSQITHALLHLDTIEFYPWSPSGTQFVVKYRLVIFGIPRT